MSNMKEVFGQPDPEEAKGNGKFTVVVHTGSGDFVHVFGPFSSRSEAQSIHDEIRPLCDSGVLYEADVQIEELHDGDSWKEVLKGQRNDQDDSETGDED